MKYFTAIILIFICLNTIAQTSNECQLHDSIPNANKTVVLKVINSLHQQKTDSILSIPEMKDFLKDEIAMSKLQALEKEFHMFDTSQMIDKYALLCFFKDKNPKVLYAHERGNGLFLTVLFEFDIYDGHLMSLNINKDANMFYKNYYSFIKNNPNSKEITPEILSKTPDWTYPTCFKGKVDIIFYEKIKEEESFKCFASWMTIYAGNVTETETPASSEFPQIAASFPGGQSELTKFLEENIVYPADARKKRIEGTVFIKIDISEDGNIFDYKVLRGIGGGCDEEVERVVKLMPKWIPGMENGKNSISHVMLPVKFKL